MKKELLKTLIREFQLRDLPALRPRELKVPVDTNKIITLTGVRRSGKSSILLEIIRKLRESIAPHFIVYLNFEDERLDLSVDELDLILQAKRELDPDLDLSQCYFFFDEIQNIPQWEKFVRRIDDTISRRLFITGSNSHLLGNEIATALRGRTLRYDVFPLSFSEYLSFRSIDVDIYDPRSQARLVNSFDTFLVQGGFPEAVLLDDKDINRRLIAEYFDVMIYRDLIERYEESNPQALRFFLRRCIEGVTSPLSVNKIHNELKSAGFRISKNKLYDYLEHANAIYLLQLAHKFDPSLVRRELGERKVYVIDNAIINSMSWNAGQDKGKLLENLVALELRKQGKELFFVKGKTECDFIIKASSEGEEVLPLQVCYDLGQTATRQRELKALIHACQFCGSDRGLILTHSTEDQFEQEGIHVAVLPAWKYFTRKMPS